MAAIRESLKRNGQYRPLIVNRPSMEVLAGNHTLLAARELGWASVDVYFVEVDDERARRIALADNRTADLAWYDSEQLVSLLEEFDDLAGYELADLDGLLDELSTATPVEDDEVPSLPAEPVTRPGDLIELGDHRLVCGDARHPKVLERLLGADEASLLWTDPPFGVDYAGKTSTRLRIQNDSAAGLDDLLREAFAAADGVLAAGAPLYVAHPAGPNAFVFMRAFQETGWQLRQVLVWVKDVFVLGRSDYHYKHEPILYGFKRADGRLGRGARVGSGITARTRSWKWPVRVPRESIRP